MSSQIADETSSVEWCRRTSEADDVVTSTTCEDDGKGTEEVTSRKPGAQRSTVSMMVELDRPGGSTVEGPVPPPDELHRRRARRR